MEIYKSFYIEKNIKRNYRDFDQVIIVHFTKLGAIVGYNRKTITSTIKSEFFMEKVSFLELSIKFEINAKDYIPELIEGNKMDLL